MTAPNEFERFAIVRLNGGAVPDGAVFHGSWPEVMEHIPSSKVIKQKLKIINDAARAESRLQSIRDREAALRQGEAQLKADHAGFNHDVIGELARRINELEVRLAQHEAAKARGPDDDMPPPPGEPSPPFLHARPDPGAALADDGDLEVKGPTTNKADPDIDTDGEALPLKAPVSLDDEEEIPDPELPKPPVTAQPISVGLDEE